MAITSTLVGRDVWGSKGMTYGTFSGSGTGGDVNTYLHTCEQLLLTPTTAAAKQCGITTTLPAAGAAITIIVDTSVDGYWMAIGDAFA
jgi:hypothetical protein